MPNWKKLIASGSDASLNSLNVNGGITSNGTITANAYTGNFQGSIASNLVSAAQLNVSGNGTTSQYLRSDGDGTFTWATPPNTTYSVGNGGLTEINFTSALNTKLAGIAAGANNYSLPEATATTIGGIELFSNTDQSTAANAVSSTAGRTYGIQLNSVGQAVVNVPWSDTNTNTTYTAGIGLSLVGTEFRNASPDQTVTLTGAGAATISGTYPNFTISSTDTDTNTVTSIRRDNTGTYRTGNINLVGGTNVTISEPSIGVFNISSTDTNTTTTSDVTAAGALMDSELSNIAAVKGINQNLTTTSNVTFNDITTNGVSYGLYHSVLDDNYYFDDYNGARNLSMFAKSALSDILRYRQVDNYEYYNGSAWVADSSKLSSVKNLLDGRQDTSYSVPQRDYKFRFTTSQSSSWPTMAMIFLQSSWTGSTYPGCTLTIEEWSGTAWVTRVTAEFNSSNGVSNWGTAARADTALHTGNGGGTNETRITVDFYGWTPSNSSYNTIPLQNIMVTSNFSGDNNTDYTNLLDYDRNVTIDGNLVLSSGKTVDGRDVSADGSKLDGISTSANNYSLPLGSSSTRGGFKIGYSESGKNYPVELSSEQMYVNVPWTDNDTVTSIRRDNTGTYRTGNINLVGGTNVTISEPSIGVFNISSTDTNTTYSVGDGGLTERNFTNVDKDKLDSIAAGANLITNNNQLTNGAGYQTSTQVNTAIQTIVDSAPAALDTLNELAAALGDDADFAGTMTNALAGKLSTSGKAADSNLLDGLDLSTGRNNGVNQVMRTNDSGYAEFGWINTISGNTTNTITDFYVNTNDGYIRKATPAHIKSQLGLGSAAYVATSAFDSVGSATAVNTRIDNEVLPLIPTNTNQLTNGAGFITSFTNTVDMGDGFKIANYAGIDQFTVTENEKILIRGTGATSVAFDASTNKVTISSTNTEYSVGNGGLTEINFTSALNTKLAGIAAGANLITNNNQLTNGAGYITSYTDTNTTYSAGTGLTLTGTTFSLTTPITNNNQLTNGAGYITSYVNTQRSDEEIRDIAAAQWIDGSNTTVVKDDVANTIKINSTNTTYSVGDGGLTQVNFTTAFRDKLNGIAASANNYSLPVATSLVLGGVKAGTNISIDANGVISSTDTNTTYSVGNGGLTEINFTSALNTKLAGIATGANLITNNNQLTNGAGYITSYVNTVTSIRRDNTGTYRTGNINLVGGTNVTISEPSIGVFNISSTDTNTQLTDAQVRSKFSAGTNVSISDTGVISSTDTNTTYSVGNGGLTEINFTSALNTKLAGIAAGANLITNNNQLTNGAGYITSYVNTQRSDEEIRDIAAAQWLDGSNTTVVKDDVANTIKINSTNTTYSVGNGGLTEINFTSALNTKLAGIATGANLITNNNQLTNGAGYITSQRAISSTPTDGATTTAISSDWAFDNVKTAVPAGALFTDTNTQLTDAQVRSKFSAGTNVSISATGVISSTDTNTTYSVGNGGLTEINFTSALNTKLAGIAVGANLITNNNQLTNGAGYITSYTDTNTTYSAGTGLTLTGTTFSLTTPITNNNQLTNGAGYITSYVNTQRSDEEIRDIAAAQWIDGSNTTVVKDDVANTIKINSTNTTYSVGNGGLTEINFTSALNTKLAGIATGANLITNNNQLTNGAGYITSYVNTTYTAGDGITLGGLSGTTFSHSDTSTLSGTYGSTTDGTKVDSITVDSNGHITAITTGATGDIQGVTAGSGLTGGGSSGTVTLNVGAGTGIAVEADTVSLSHLGLQTLTDPNADRVLGWDDSAGTLAWFTLNSNITTSGTNINSTNTNTTYSAGTGLTLSGTTFSLSNTYDNYGAWLPGDGLTYGNIASGAKLTFVGGGATGVTFNPATSIFTITSTDNNTTYSADGNYGLTLSGTTFRLEDDRRRNSTGVDIYSGNTHDFTWYDADVGIRWYTAGVEEMRLEDAGDLHVDGDVIAFSTTVSDERLKDNVTTIENPLDKIKALRGVEYDWNSGSRKGKHDLGLIAQEVEKVIPEIVHEHKLPLMDDSDTIYKTVDYEKMVAVLIEGMKEQQTQIESLKSEIEEIKGKL